jgi:ATP-dependent DNA helicase RecG
MLPQDPIEKHFRLVTDQKAALRRLGLVTIADLVFHFPVRYEAPGEATSVHNLAVGSSVTLYGRFIKLEAKKLWKSKRPATTGTFEDGTGRVSVMWFNQPYIAKMVPVNTPVRVIGIVNGSNERPFISNPEVAILSQTAIPDGLFAGQNEEVEKSALFPVYPESRGITSRWFYHAMEKVFESGVIHKLIDPIPKPVLDTYHLPPLENALVYLHTPRKKTDADVARKRFAFEEIFLIQIAQQQERAENAQNASPLIRTDRSAVARFVSSLPFTLTSVQHRAVEEVLNDFDKSYPMARLLEGDVGSGKTAVAAATAYAVVTSTPPSRNSGTLQVAYMAPTEILATQHFESFIQYFKHLPINIALITGSGCYKFPSKVNPSKPTKISRTQLLKWVANGEIAMVVGTHALIQKTVTFRYLAYVIVDEQHRFGTKQRKALTKKGIAPHFLSMTATPIPRTLALTIYGDLDLSVLDELPPGRKPVETTVITPAKRESAYARVREELAKGRQAFVICPRVDEPDPEKEMALRAKSAEAEAKRLQKDVFPQAEVGVMHGKMKPADKDAIMQRFVDGSVHILVATSVVEVGVNVPNATVIMIEGAERFGLAQLHQLRGRVARSSHQAYCFLLPDSKSEISRKRLSSLARTNDGFKLAESDLELRGTGDLYGRKQWGISDIGMEALRNPRLIEAARTEARRFVEHDPTLSAHTELRRRIGAIKEKLHGE